MKRLVRSCCFIDMKHWWNSSSMWLILEAQASHLLCCQWAWVGCWFLHSRIWAGLPAMHSLHCSFPYWYRPKQKQDWNEFLCNQIGNTSDNPLFKRFHISCQEITPRIYMAESDFDSITDNRLLCNADGNIGSKEFCLIMTTEIKSVLLFFGIVCCQ